MFVSNFEKIVAVEFAQGRRNLIEDKIDKFAPPAFVVIFARAVDRGAARHLFPRCVKCALQRLGIEIYSDFAADVCIMIAYSLC